VVLSVGSEVGRTMGFDVGTAVRSPLGTVEGALVD
jgi:hypothetical protein